MIRQSGIAFATLLLAAQPVLADSVVVIVQGLGGNDSYRRSFDEQVMILADATRSLAPQPDLTVFAEAEGDRDAILAHLAGLADTMQDSDQLYLYLIGHGSYDDEEYKFNIRGPDLTDADIRDALDAIPSGFQVVVNTSSASGAAADMLQADNRVVISATRSGSERHATRFGGYFVAAFSDSAADLDKNRIISAQEAFNYADREVADFFETSGALPTEHARLDGELAARFTLARLDETRRLPSTDTRLAELTEARDRAAARIETLRLSRGDLSPEDYQTALLGLMLELARAEQALDDREAELFPNAEPPNE